MEPQRAGDSKHRNREYMDSLSVETRHIGSTRPDTTLSLYQKTLATPIMTLAEQDQAEIIKTDAGVIPIIKPYADNGLILERMKLAAEKGALAVGIDIGSAFDEKGEYGRADGHPLHPKSFEELKEFADATAIPLVVKGVLSRQDAYQCLKAGVKGIVISHGKVEDAVPILKILPDICKVIGKEIPVWVEGEIESGMDAFKALCLGATAVCVKEVDGKLLGERGLEEISDMALHMTEELKGIMAKTGCRDMNHMDASVIWDK